MLNLKDNVVVITGAASGIGRQLALQFAALNCHLALCDVNAQELQKTVTLIHNKSIKIKTNILDVANQKAVFKYATEVINHFGHVDRVINNAGKTGGGFIKDISPENFKLIMDINFYGSFYITKAFLPHLLTQPNASIVNISSVNAFVPFPSNGAYNCSKYALYGLSETLHQELADTKVKVTSVHPGGIKTNIIINSNKVDPNKTDADLEKAQADFHKITLTTSEKAARLIIIAMRKKRSKVLIGTDAKFMSLFKRLFPTLAVSFLGKISMKMQYPKNSENR